MLYMYALAVCVCKKKAQWFLDTIFFEGQLEVKSGMVNICVGWSPDWGQWTGVNFFDPSRDDSGYVLVYLKCRSVMLHPDDQPVQSVIQPWCVLDDSLWM